jgi:hypothetical protein
VVEVFKLGLIGAWVKQQGENNLWWGSRVILVDQEDVRMLVRCLCDCQGSCESSPPNAGPFSLFEYCTVGSKVGVG